MENIKKHTTLNENGSTQTAVAIISAAFALLIIGYLLIGHRPVEKSKENRSNAQDALKAAGFNKLADKVYGKD